MSSVAGLRFSRPSLNGWKPNALVSNSAWGVADQCLISLTNFLTMVFLARSMMPSAFGVFVVLYTGLLFANALQMSIITRPLNVLAAPLSEEAFRVYTAYASTAQFILAAAFSLIALVGAAVAYFSGSDLFPMLVALAIAVFAWQMQEFVRQARYTQARIGEAFSYDLISYGGQTLLIAALWAADMLTGAGALYAIAATSAVSALYGFSRLALPERGFSLAAMRRSWHFGKWLVVECLGQWLSIQLFPLLAAAIVGVTAAAHLKAVQTLVAPAHIVLNAFQALAVPRAARKYAAGGRQAMLRFLVPAAAVAALPLFFYWLAIGVMGSWLMGLLYGDQYQGHGALIWLFSLSYLSLHVVQAESVGLMAMGNTRSIVVGRVVAVVLTLTLGVWVTWQFGVYGALIGLALTQAAMAAVLAYQLAKAGREAAGAATPGREGRA